MRISDWSSDVCSSDLSSGNPYTAALFDTWRHWSNACLSALGAGGRGFKSLLPDALTSHAGELIVHNLGRSEEHTSELQSLMRISYAVFCLTKKNNEP